MKPDAHKAIERYRTTSGPLASDASFRNNGRFILPLRKSDNGEIRLSVTPSIAHCLMCVVVSDGEGWDHVSASFVNRCPNWEEMCFVKDLFFEQKEAVMQLHPPRSEYVNHHKFCLHLWRPHNKRIPLPPSIFVGPKREAFA